MFKITGLNKFKDFKGDSFGLSSKLRYFGLIDEGIIINTDGSLLTSFAFRGVDLDLSTDEEMNALSSRINQALCMLDFGSVLHIDSIRLKANKYIAKEECFFANATTELIDEERRFIHEQGDNYYESKFVLNFTWLPPKDFINSSRSIIFGKKNKNQVKTMAIEEGLSLFKEQVNKVISILKRCFTEVVQLNNSQLLEYLHYCVTGINQPIKVPKKPVFLQYILASKDYITDSFPMIGDKHIKVISIYDFPETGTCPAILNILNNVPFECRWNTRFIYVKKTKAISYIKKIMETWGTKRKGVKEWLATTIDTNANVKENIFAIQQEQDAQSAFSEISGGQSKFGFYTNSVIIMDEDEELANAKANEISSILSSLGFTNQIEKFNTVDAFEGSWPGYSYENVRKPGLKTMNLADLMPQTAIWTGAMKNECRYFIKNNPVLMYTKSIGFSPFRLNLHVGDNGNTMILGPVRSGKSTLLGLIIAQWFRYKDAKVFVFDKGRSALPLCYACSGTHYDLFSNENNPEFQPLAMLGKNKYELVWAQQWVESLCELQGLELSIDIRNAITTALELVATMADYNKTITSLATQVNNLKVRAVLERYSNKTEIGAIFDAEVDEMQLSDFTVFEMENLFSTKNDAITIPIITYLFHRIQLQFTGAPTIMVLDEFFLFLDHPVFRTFLKGFIKTVNKLNVTMIFATQQASDLFNSELKEVLVENTATFILLPNANANSKLSSKHYLELGLNEKQIDILANAVPQKEYFIKSNNGVRLFDLGLEDNPGALALIGKTSLEDIKKARELYAEHKEKFAYYWLKEHKLEKYAELWLKYFDKFSKNKNYENQL